MLGERLQAIRKELGFKSARAFYQSLSQRAKLDFNYSYYMKIEAGQLLPSPKIIHQLSALMTKAHMEQVILCYCSSIFPQQRHLFGSDQGAAVSVNKSMGPKPKSADFADGKQLLTERQLAALAANRETYFLFLLLSLARNGLPEPELLRFFSVNSIEESKATLLQIKLAYSEGDRLFPSHSNYQLPRAESQSLKNLYKMIDRFDQERDGFFKLEKKCSGATFRRIPAGYSDILVKHMDLLLQTIRMADEQDQQHNNLAISVNVELSTGKLPG